MDYRYFTSKKHINQIRNFLHRRCSETYSWECLGTMSDAECFNILENVFGLIPLIEFKNHIYNNDIKKIYLIDSDGNIVITLNSDK
jgi:hypothetical protein